MKVSVPSSPAATSRAARPPTARASSRTASRSYGVPTTASARRISSVSDEILRLVAPPPPKAGRCPGFHGVPVWLAAHWNNGVYRPRSTSARRRISPR